MINVERCRRGQKEGCGRGGGGGGGGSTYSVENRGQREGDLGAVAHYSGILEAAVIWYKEFHFI